MQPPANGRRVRKLAISALMANREEMTLLRGARAGDAACQLALGKLYLQGGAGLPRSLPTALHWLCRAADQGMTDAADLLARLHPSEPTVLARGVAPDRGAERVAQLAMGLRWARMDHMGERVAQGAGNVNFKRAIGCLAQAGELGEPGAWFVLARIYMRPEFSQRSASEARACLERAAALGHPVAQFECGMGAWRLRREEEENDVRAVYWLQKAAAQGCEDAHAALERIVPPSAAGGWTAGLARLPPQVLRDQLASQPLLAARIELALQFQLSRAEALLLDVKTADRGHCLVVDIRAAYGRSRRRIVLVRNARQRQALDRAARVFEPFDSSAAGPEGNYRRRLYRLKTWLAQVAGADGLLAA